MRYARHIASKVRLGASALPRSYSAAAKPKLIEFHIMKFGATPARLLAIVHVSDEKAALAEAIERHRIRPHLQRRLIVGRAA
jgi:hypothetical protein